MDKMINVAYDMETGDPDDYFTLCILAGHPRVSLKCVTINPGTKLQVGFVKLCLKRLKLDIPVGSKDIDYPKTCISGFYQKIEPQMVEMDSDGEACDILASCIEKFPDLTVITGGALSNLSKMLIKYPDLKVQKWVGQGGFAGDNVVPKKLRLPQFDGMITCPTFNFNADIKAADIVLESKNIQKRVLCSKNVCHGVKYDLKLHEKLAKLVNGDDTGLDMLFEGMKIYLTKKSEKKFHDPLAALCAIDESICKFEQVELYHEKVKWVTWGSKPSLDSNTFISISVDWDKFTQCLFEQPTLELKAL